MDSTMRIGLFGGTFDPIHFGHLRAALEVQEGFGLTRVFLIPAAVPPHKARDGVAPAADRLHMIAAAVAGEPCLAASDVEIRRTGPSYTIDTVRHFFSAVAGAAEIFLIMGLDAFLEIDTWKSYRELLALVSVIVISRPEADGPRADHGGKALGDFIRARISTDVAASGAPVGFRGPGVRGVRLFPVTALDISSSRIRELVAAGRSIRFLVPAAVCECIQTKGLYS
jgi:nicotinate-nucleotide adenylyltransferase